MALITVPAWPLFKLNPLNWLEAEIPVEFRKAKKTKKDKEE